MVAGAAGIGILLANGVYFWRRRRTLPAGKRGEPPERLAALQKERQTRWQKIMNFLTGKFNEQTSP